jgi:aspartate racemase
MHRVAPAIEETVAIPFLHIADPTAEEIRRTGLMRVGLLGTRFTMEQEFYRQRLQDLHGIAVLIPDDADREIIHRVIYDELCVGKILDASRDHYRRIINRLVERGAKAVILGCTEISMLVGAADSPVPIFDTTSLHARSVAEWATSEG